MKNSKILYRISCVLLFTFACSLSLSAQKKVRSLWVWQVVYDEMSREPIEGLTCYLLNASDSSVVNTFKGHVGNRYSRPTTILSMDSIVAGNYIIKLVAEGYETKCIDWELKPFSKYIDRYDFDKPFYMRKLRKREQALSGVVVKATKVKMFYKGDTLVYNADAFETAEGSMLEELIKQLPGTELKPGGEIVVNGRRVDELLLNGKDFFNKDRTVILENLPTYMVKNIRVFEKEDKMAERMGDKNAEKKLAMDVKLKKEYEKTLVSNLEAGAGTDNRFLGRLFALRSTPKSSLMAFANVNNLNDSRRPGKEGVWSPLQQAVGVTTLQDVGFSHKYDIEDFANSTDVRVTNKKVITDSYTNKTNFLTTGNTYGRGLNVGEDHNTTITFSNNSRFPKLGWIKWSGFEPQLSYTHYKSSTLSASATIDDDVASQWGKAWRDSISAPNAGRLLRTNGINRVRNNSKGSGHKLKTGAEMFLMIQSPKNTKLLWILQDEIDYSNSKQKAFEHYNLQYFKTHDSEFRNRYNYNDSYGLTNTVKFGTGNIYLLPEQRFDIMPRYNYTYRRQKQARSLYLLNRLDGWNNESKHALGELPSADEMLQALDNGNSLHTLQTDHEHNTWLQFQFRKNRGKTMFYVYFRPQITFQHSTMHYERGTMLDTLFHRNTVLPSIESSVSIYPDTNPWPWHVKLEYKLNAYTPNMTYLADYRDDSNPLYITKGNRNLRNNQVHYYALHFTRNMKNQRTLYTKIDGNIRPNMVAMGYVYDATTGVRTVTPENINGNWDISGCLNYSARLDSKDKFTYSTYTNATYVNSVDLVGVYPEQGAVRSKVGSTYIDETLKFNCRFSSKASLSFKADLHYQNSTSDRENFQTINAADFDYGLSGVFELPLNFQISTDLTMYSRRGYNDRSMNTNELVWNARLAKRFMHGNLTCMLDAFDLLGNLSNVRRTINAQGRTETWYSVTPQYAMFHVVYRFNKSPKK